MQAIPTTNIDVDVSGEERDILIDIVGRERTNLPIEIHHTRTAKFRDSLKLRLAIVDTLYKRLLSP
jgi:hypothetical protein